MTKHTQAHLTRTLSKSEPSAIIEKTQSQMEYYMGAKLIEMGVNPKSAIYRWSVSNQNEAKLWKLSAYWDKDKENLLSGKFPLTGIDLIDCARANAASGLETAAKLCGYGGEIRGFQAALEQASSQIGINIESLSELISLSNNQGIDIAPDTNSSL